MTDVVTRDAERASAAAEEAQGRHGSTRPGQVSIIAEMACSHEGDPALARAIIDGAGRAGADAMQFQIWSLADMVVPHHPDYQKLTGLELSRAQWTDLASYVRDRYPAMQIIACVYERASADFCERIGVDAYKIHSADLSNPWLVRHVARSGKRIDLSIGASTLDEIQTALEWIRAASPSTIWLMYGFQDFPTRAEDLQLEYMRNLKQLFGLPVGYQDHSDAEHGAAWWLPAAAVGMGIDILEKHLTDDRSRKGVDHEAALNPDEFVRFVGMIREIEAAKGQAAPKPFSPAELRYRRYAKKSLVASRPLAAGTRLTEADLVFMRADRLGLPPDQAGRLVGRMTKRKIETYHVIQEEDVA
ncbi:MAG: N-acetylneuraminate synthase family protein [Candidatus Omnitrophota bacterium]|nr:N-acetylneuraminate synthase family protein [Candidatus Omnitrophota bacterium]